ncbi:MAG: hypothetical protein K2Y39_09825 [Candidatus Obscuribacterales bacterium]|nr:hypothetical protein [Candidatus Obscuribacterales bacterium]
MTTFAVDLASLGTTFLFLIISFVAGLAVAIAGAVLGGAGELLLGFAKAVAGDRSYASQPTPSALPVFVRSLIYIALGFVALYLAATGMALWGNLLGIFAAFCLGVAAVRFFSRI